jgi:type I restriction enzyme S subunit
MKQGWEVKKLGDLCNLMTGGTPTRSKPEYFIDGEIKWLVSGDIHKTEIYDCAGRITNEAMANSNAKYLPINSVIIALNGQGKTRGTVALLRVKATCNQSLVSIFPKHINEILPEYIYCNLHGRYDEIRRITGDDGNDRRGLNMPLIRNIEIPLPPLKKQQRIVAILDEAFAVIAKAKANAEQNLKNAKELFESYLQSVFENKGEGWEEKTLGEICEISSKLIDPKKPEFQDLIHIGAGNIESQKGTLLNLKTAKEEGLISGKFLFDESMVLYSKIRPYLMKVFNCNFQGLCSADIYPLLPFKDKITKDFLYHLLLTKDFTAYAIFGSQRAGMPKVNREHLFAYRIHLPPLKDQQAIVQKLDALSSETKQLEAIYQQKINDLDELKKSILQKAFAGELH